jgi:TetR/AcrR family transcriptional repressor of nem operon
MGTNAKEAILAAATRTAQAHGYGGLNFRDLAADVGIMAASIYHHFPRKAEIGTAVARRYWEDTKAQLKALLAESEDPRQSLSRYPGLFRTALTRDNRICMCSFMAAEYDDLPDAVKKEMQTFANVNVEWLANVVSAAKIVAPKHSEARGRAIFAAVAGAQLLARSRADIALFDRVIESYRLAGLLPTER